MAESGLPSNNGIQPSSSSSSAAAAPDWEMLTMSMSSSALGRPRGDDPEPDSNKAADQHEISLERSLKEGGVASDAKTDPLRASIGRDASTDAEDEPFTEGWKLHRSSSSLYGNASEKGRQEMSNEAGETYFESNAPNVPECLFLSDKDDGHTERRALSDSHSVDEIKFVDAGVNKKIKHKGEKHSSRFSTVVWSVAVVASLTGIVFLGNCLRIAYNQNQQLEIQLSDKDEKLNEVLFQVKRLKEVLGNHHIVPLSKD